MKTTFNHQIMLTKQTDKDDQAYYPFASGPNFCTPGAILIN
jgi:hypothetical protein